MTTTVTRFSIQSLTNADLELLAEQLITSFEYECDVENEDWTALFTLVLTNEGKVDLLSTDIRHYTGYGVDAVECCINCFDIIEGKKWIIDCLLESISCFDN